MGMIEELKINEQVQLRLFMKACDLRKTNTKPARPFLSIALTDGTSELDGKLWNYNEVLGLPTIKQCYDVVGVIGEYQGRKQINITSITLSDNQDTTMFTINVGVPIEELWNAILEAIGLIKHDMLREIVLKVYMRYRDILAPASSAVGVHHVGAGGNLLHTLETFNIANGIFDAFSGVPGYSNSISKSLVRAGALLHDIGKAKVYAIDGPVVEYTYEGHLHDHIVTGILMITEMEWSEAEKPIIELLIHMIAAHHGKLEFGSPVVPKFIEAHIVSYADGVSATVDTIRAANEKPIKDYNVTERIYACNNASHISQDYIVKLLTAQ